MAFNFTLKDKIFGYFGIQAKRNDTYKDINGKGISERYQECIGEDYDEEIQDLVDNFHDNTLVPQKCFSKFIEFLEYNLGNPIIVIDNESTRRKILSFQNSITLIKGTRLSYDILYSILGLTVSSINLIVTDSGFDSSYTLDDDNRKFDSGAICCQHYELVLTGVATQDDELNASILRIAQYLRAIDSVLESITYNGNPVPL